MSYAKKVIFLLKKKIKDRFVYVLKFMLTLSNMQSNITFMWKGSKYDAWVF